MNGSDKELEVNESPIDEGHIVEKDADYEGIPSKYRGTASDKRDMFLLGKKQVLRASDLETGID